MTSHPDDLPRCSWVSDDSLYREYHDREWGVPEKDPQRLYEMLMLEGFQAGLSWITILRKRDAFRTAFVGFQPEVVARFGASEVARLLTNPAIVRHRGKIEATIAGARSWLDLMDKHPGGFTSFVWEVVDGKPQVNHWVDVAHIPADTAESRVLSRRLKQAGFRFVGPSICYAFMQAAGLVDDHLPTCFRRDPALGGRRSPQ